MSHKNLRISGSDLSSVVFSDCPRNCPRRDVKTLGGITKIASAHDIVSLEHASSLVPRHLHRDAFRNSRAHEITDRLDRAVGVLITLVEKSSHWKRMLAKPNAMGYGRHMTEAQLPEPQVCAVLLAMTSRLPEVELVAAHVPSCVHCRNVAAVFTRLAVSRAGRSTSPAKANAARTNGRLGGRPRRLYA